jgi:hypothetical protein
MFRRQAEKIWSDAELTVLVDHLATNPEDGDVIPGTGGIRKLHWGKAGTGKRGGVWVIYFYHNADMPLYLLLAYAKAQATDLTQDEKRTLTALAAALKQGKG